MLLWARRVLFVLMLLGIAALALYAQEPPASNPALPRAPATWPEDASGWAALIGELLAIGALVYAALMKWLNGKIKASEERTVDLINKVGGRVNAVEPTVAMVNDLREQVRVGASERGSMREAVGRLEGLIERVAQENTRRDEKLANSMQDMAISVGKMQTEMALFREAKDDILALIRQARDA